MCAISVRVRRVRRVRGDASVGGADLGCVLRRGVGTDDVGDENVRLEDGSTADARSERTPAVRGRVRQGVPEHELEHVGADGDDAAEDDQREQRVLVERAGSVRDDADRERGAIVL